ncbi:hypothetical protein FSP39_011276 [Pinctada imbricata]|uniref:[histone H3]-dimethyl-L-lysine(9) demethylase n=1 Tax=Pinctada imbricata TaxID=66713 RepID=A0AA88Y026_PINIB|nr:hypothetical protein FSP39_011276 [Pinctada imbricata]
MAYKCREEIVGKRFLSVGTPGKLKLSKISEWEWRSGVVRAISAKDTSRVDLSVLIEFDDRDWQKREWVRIHNIFQVFLVEHTLVWSERSDPENLKQTIDWPALNFRSIVDKVGLSGIKKRAIEFLEDSQLAFVEDRSLKCHEEGEEVSHPTVVDRPAVGLAIKAWLDYQDGQKLLLTTPTILVGYRLEVYRAEGTTQWYTAVIQGYNHTTKTLVVTDDTVLEEHNEDPALIQMRLLDDGVVDFILRGVEIGIGARRTRQTNKDKDQVNAVRNSTQQQNSTSKPLPRNAGTKAKQKEVPVSVPALPQESEKEKQQQKSKPARDRKRKPNESQGESVSSVNTKRTKAVDNKKAQVLDEKADSPKVRQTDKSESEKSEKRTTPVKDLDTRLTRDKLKTITQTHGNKKDTGNKDNHRIDKSVKPSSRKGSPLLRNKTRESDKSNDVCDNQTESDTDKGVVSENENLANSVTEEKCSGNDELDPKAKGQESDNDSKKELCDTVISKDVTEKTSCDKIKSSQKSSSECSETETKVSSDNSEVTDTTDDNMHYMKQRLLNSSTSSDKNPAPSLAANIDVNRSVTEQIAKLTRSENSSSSQAEEDKSTASTSKSVSPKTSSHYENQLDHKDYRNHNSYDVNALGSLSSTVNSHAEDHFRSSSRASDHSNSGCSADERRPGSRVEDIRVSSKNSPATSPLVIDKAEPVHPYRDPELMKKNTVHSNVHGMLGAQKYPNVPTPIPSASPVTLPSTTSYPSHPIASRSHVLPSMHYPPTLPSALSGAAALSQLGLSPGLSQLDPTSLAALQQQQQLAAMQYNLLLARSYPSPANLTLPQLEHLWQQKYPHVPIPSYMLAKNQEDVLSQILTLKERELLERERIERERIERERLDRLEREKQLERERQERIERERIEREKLERERELRERAEKERLEKERIDRERKEQEWKRQEHEREQKKERERILKESADTLASVDEHFARSLRNKQMETQAMWTTPSITKGTGKGMRTKVETEGSKAPKTTEDFVKQEIERQYTERHYTEEMFRRQQEYLRSQEERYLKQRMMEQKEDAKHKVSKNIDDKSQIFSQSGYKGFPPSTTAGMPVKAEPSFSIYGYNPHQLSYITPDQLHLHGLDKKDDKSLMEAKQSLASVANRGHSSSPKRSSSSIPPPLIKDSKPHSSVIVENRGKDGSKSASPRPAHSHHGSNLSLSSSPRSHPKPAHTPTRQLDHQEQSMDLSQSSSGLRVSPQSAFRSTDGKHLGSRTQSPLSVASPHQLNAAIMQQPVNYHRDGKSKNTPPGKSTGHLMSAAIAQPPVSLPQGAYSCSLIQQGLVPNPIYSQNTVKSAAEQQNSPNQLSNGSLTTHSVAATSSHSTHSFTGQGVKRKNNKEGSGRKRQKSESSSVNNSNSGISIPVTTPQILTNHSPYTTSNSVNSGVMSDVMSKSTPSVSASSSSASMLSSPAAYLSASSSAALQGPSGFMDSFKSFVENAVQNAFFQDQDLNRKKPQTQSQPGPVPTSLPQQQTSQQQSGQQQRPQSNPVQNNSSASTNEESTSQTLGNSTSSLNSSNSASMEVNRNDTDSDTLSAPSPPPHFKDLNSASPNKSANHPKLKKAWLQRHSDEDKEIKNSSSPPRNEGEGQPQEDIVKNCYVNLYDISPSKEGGTKSPISARVLPNGNILKEDEHGESTTSASETESQIADISTGKKRSKTKRNNNGGAKKAKGEVENTEEGSSQSKKKTKKSKESKESSTKSSTTKNKEPVEEEKNNTKKSEEGSCSKKVKEVSKSSSLDQSPEQMDVDSKPIEKAEKSPEQPHPTKTEKKKQKKPKEQTKSEQQLPSPPESLNNSPQANTQQTQPLNTQQNASSFNKPLVKATTTTLKKTCEPFLQDGSCSEVTPKLMKCRECKMTPTQRSKKLPNIFCRFWAFRRLRYSQKGFLTIAGFSELTDAENDDIEPWLPHVPLIEPKIDIETSKYIVAKVGDKFCELVQQEQEAKNLAGDDAKIAWKRAVTGVREMCDVCDTTLFNMHWVCHKCGFVVCLDCYKVRIKAVRQENGEEEEDPLTRELSDEQRQWLTCSANRSQHEPDKLMLTQIIPRDALWEVGKLIHDMKKKWSIKTKCTCGQANSKLMQKNGINQQYVQQALNHLANNKTSKKMVNGIGEDHKMYKGKKQEAINGNVKYNPDSSSPLSLLADVASMDSENSRDRSESPFGKGIDKYGKSYNPITEPVSPIGGGNNTGEGENDKKNPASCSTLRELLTKTANVKNEKSKKSSKSKSGSSSLDDIIQSVVEKQLPKDGDSQPMKLMHYVPRFGYSGMIARDAPILVHNLTETSVLYPDVPHSWLCDGRLLRLHDPKHRGNFKIFQEQWKRGQPVLVSGVHKALNKNLWSPQSFSKQFGREKNDLVNCSNGNIIVGHPMSCFWDGFEKLLERLVDEENNQPLLLKLKDWPPGDDFSEIMPNHFDDLMQALPLPEYTHRHGKLNLASRLPDFLVRPDLGPKMYNAYGSAFSPQEGTTNLHLDVSDAVNCMVYVGIPDDGPGGKQHHVNAALKAIDDAGCDIITKRRIREINEVPGALWHIFDAADADKIRDFLNMVGKERGEEVELHHDPIHDQSWYLDNELRDRLYKEYGVLGYTIVQCMGDAVFIPAGAPHQVKNLHSCIKVAEDFVSPEHLNHCFSLTQEFRLLSDTHSNHEDKLQVKNIIYHAVKDSLAVLNNADPDDD